MPRSLMTALFFTMLTGLHPLYAKKEGRQAIDSIVTRLSGAADDTNKASLLSALSYEYAYISPDSGVNFGNQALALASKLAWKPGIAAANGRLGINYMYKGDYQQALAYDQKALLLQRELGNNDKIAATLTNIGMVRVNEGNYAEALQYFQQALDIYEQLKDNEGMASEMSNFGMVYDYKSEYAKALEYYFKALKIYETLGNRTKLMTVTMNIGSNYHSQGDYPKANEYFANALHLSEETGNKYGIASAYLNMSANAGDQKDHSRSLEYGAKALKMFEELGDKKSIATVTGNMGSEYQALKNYGMALVYEQKAITVASEIGAKLVVGWNQYNAGTCFFLMATDSSWLAQRSAETELPLHFPTKKADLLRNSAEYTRRGLALALELKKMDLAEACYETLAGVYETMGDYKKALDAVDNYYAIRDSIYIEDNKQKIAKLAYDYNLGKKQDSIALLEKGKQLDAEKIRRGAWQRNAIVICSLLTLALIVTILLARAQRKTKRMQIEFTRSLMQNSEAERQRISRELHDSIGQNMLFIKNRLDGENNNGDLTPVIETISSTIDDVRNISKDLYPNQLERYGLAAAVDALAEKTTEATGIFISADMHEIEGLPNKEASINLYRIIQESLSNAAKHAGAKAVRITGTRDGDNMVVSVKDNGKGFDTAILERKAQRSFGLLNMEERAKMLGGALFLESTANGTTITITIPMKNET